jgi:hypothetical protein
MHGQRLAAGDADEVRGSCLLYYLWTTYTLLLYCWQDYSDSTTCSTNYSIASCHTRCRRSCSRRMQAA